MIDSHCHLSQVDYDLPVVDLIKLAEKEGVQKMLNIACDTNDWGELLDVIKKHKNVYGAIGIHPEYATEQESATVSVEDICALTTDPKIVAIGEAGLDYHYGSPETRQAQIDLFRIHLKAA